MDQSLRPGFARTKWQALVGVGAVGTIVGGLAVNALWDGIKAVLFEKSTPPGNVQITNIGDTKVSTQVNVSAPTPRAPPPVENAPSPPRKPPTMAATPPELSPPLRPPEPATPASAEPSSFIASELRRIEQKLQKNPGYHEALEAYAGPVLDEIIAQRDQTHACEAIVHWRRYAEGPCQHVDFKFTQVVAHKLPTLLRLCPSERLPQNVLLRCKPEPVL